MDCPNILPVDIAQHWPKKDCLKSCEGTSANISPINIFPALPNFGPANLTPKSCQWTLLHLLQWLPIASTLYSPKKAEI